MIRNWRRFAVATTSVSTGGTLPAVSTAFDSNINTFVGFFMIQAYLPTL